MLQISFYTERPIFVLSSSQGIPSGILVKLYNLHPKWKKISNNQPIGLKGCCNHNAIYCSPRDNDKYEKYLYVGLVDYIPLNLRGGCVSEQVGFNEKKWCAVYDDCT